MAKSLGWKLLQHIVIVSELTHNQWLYLGHLQSINPALSIELLTSVDAPPNNYSLNV